LPQFNAKFGEWDAWLRDVAGRIAFIVRGAQMTKPMRRRFAENRASFAIDIEERVPLGRYGPAEQRLMHLWLFQAEIDVFHFQD
jgi:hypothetical protein